MSRDTKPGLVSLDNIQETNEILNSPRSLEACLRQGVDPTELIAKPLDSFLSKAYSRDVALLKHEHYEKRRKDKLRGVREERQLIMRYLQEFESTEGAGPEDSPKTLKRNPLGRRTLKFASSKTPQRVEQTAEEAALIETERRRLEAIQKRQMQEIAQMMQHEKKLAQIQAEKLAKEAADRARAQQREQERYERRQLLMQQKRERELARRRAEEREHERQRELAMKAFREEQAQRELEEQRQRQQELEARARERERQKKAEEARARTEAIMAAQEEVAHQKMLRMEEEEAKRQAMLAEKQARQAEKSRAKMAKARERITKALAANEALRKRKSAEYVERQRQSHARQEAMSQRVEAEAQAKREAQAAAEAERVKRLQNVRRKQRERVVNLMNKQAQAQAHLRQVQLRRQHERDMKVVRKQLVAEDKMDNVERLKRVTEFVRLQTLQKIQADDAKTERLKQQRAALIEQRKKSSLQALVRRHELKASIEQMRVSKKWDGGSGSKKKRRGRRKRRMRGSKSMPAIRGADGSTSDALSMIS